MLAVAWNGFFSKLLKPADSGKPSRLR